MQLFDGSPLDASIMRVSKCKYKKMLLKYVVSRTDEDFNIMQDVDISKAIHWLQVPWRDVSTETIINCFQKFEFGQESVNSITSDNEIVPEFESLLTQLREHDEITFEDFVTFDDNLATSTGQINTDLKDWQEQAREEAIKEVVSDTSTASKHPLAPYYIRNTSAPRWFASFFHDGKRGNNHRNNPQSSKYKVVFLKTK